jgi:type II secretory pathway pseudopilin PulG
MCAHPRHKTFAFTLVELLTVVMILTLLIAMLVPSITKVRQLAMIKMTQATINTLDAGCKAYAVDFGGLDQWQNFPPSRDATYNSGGDGTPGAWWRGSQLLALYLQGYAPDLPSGAPDGTRDASGRLDQDDGKEGPGFRLDPRGKVYGPYNDADKLNTTSQYEDPRMASQAHAVPRYFLDAFDRAILYYRFTGTNYNVADNGIEGYVVGSPSGSAAANEHPTPGPTNIGAHVGVIDSYAKDFASGASAKYLRTDFLLLSRGPNGGWCTGGSVANSDDITNMFPNR